MKHLRHCLCRHGSRIIAQCLEFGVNGLVVTPSSLPNSGLGCRSLTPNPTLSRCCFIRRFLPQYVARAKRPQCALPSESSAAPLLSERYPNSLSSPREGEKDRVMLPIETAVNICLTARTSSKRRARLYDARTTENYTNILRTMYQRFLKVHEMTDWPTETSCSSSGGTTRVCYCSTPAVEQQARGEPCNQDVRHAFLLLVSFCMCPLQ